MKIQIRKAQKQDLPAVCRLSQEWAEQKITYGYSATDTPEMAGYTLWVAEADGTVIGYLGGNAYDSHRMKSILPEGTSCFEIEELYVKAGMRNNGTGRLLYDTVTAELAQRGISCVTLIAANQNSRQLLNFYQKAGMSTFSTRLFQKLNAPTGRLYLHTPSVEELCYRQKWMADPATMLYNRGYDLAFDGYNRETGCIDFPQAKWQKWYDGWIGQEPKRFYAYLVRRQDNVFLGEIDLHQSAKGNWYEMGVVIEAKYRGLGYAGEALVLLLHEAFVHNHAQAVHNSFKPERRAALIIHLKAGFRITAFRDGILSLELTREDYQKHHMEGFL